MSRQFERPTILLLDPRESPDIIGPGQELEVMQDWIKHVDSAIQVHVNRGNEYQVYGKISHVVGVFPQTTTLTQNYIGASTDPALSQVLTLPPSTDQEESSIYKLLSCAKKISCYIPGIPLNEVWSKGIQAKQIIFFPLQYTTEDNDKPYIHFKNTIRFIIDVTSPCKNSEDTVRAMLEAISTVRCEDKQKEIVLLCKDWIPHTDSASSNCDIRMINVTLVHEIQRFFNDSIWLLPSSGTYISWLNLQPTLHRVPHIMHKDNPVIKTLGDIPVKVQEDLVWDGKDKSNLLKTIQAIIDNPVDALEKIYRVSLFLRECDVVWNSRDAFYEDILGQNIVPIKLNILRENKSVAVEETSKFLKILNLGFRKTLRGKKLRNKEDKKSSKVNVCKSAFSRLPARIIGIREGSVVLLMYVPDDTTYEKLDLGIKDKTIGQDLGLIALGAWEDIFHSSNISGYTLHTSLQKLGGEFSESGFQLNATDNHGGTLFHRSAYSGAVKFVNSCLEEGHAVNTVTSLGRTALHLASDNGHADVCQILLDHGAAKEKPDWSGKTALHFASYKGHADVCQVLLDHGAATDIPDYLDQTALHRASYNGHAAVFQILLDHGAATDKQDRSGHTALHIASYKGHADVCQILMDHGAATDKLDRSGQTALHLASFEGHADVSQILLDYRAATDKLDRWDQTALHFASDNGHADVCQILLDHGAATDITDKWCRTALRLASYKGHADVCQVLLEHGAATDKADYSGQTVLHLASDNGHADVCQILMDNGAATDKQDWWGQTALHIASHKGHADVCQILLDHGAATDKPDRNVSTALHMASAYGHISVCQLLFDHGAGIGVKNRDGKRPLNYINTHLSKIIRNLLSPRARVHGGIVQEPKNVAGPDKTEVIYLLLSHGFTIFSGGELYFETYANRADIQELTEVMYEAGVNFEAHKYLLNLPEQVTLGSETMPSIAEMDAEKGSTDEDRVDSIKRCIHDVIECIDKLKIFMKDGDREILKTLKIMDGEIRAQRSEKERETRLLNEYDTLRPKIQHLWEKFELQRQKVILAARWFDQQTLIVRSLQHLARLVIRKFVKRAIGYDSIVQAIRNLQVPSRLSDQLLLRHVIPSDVWSKYLEVKT